MSKITVEEPPCTCPDCQSDNITAMEFEDNGSFISRNVNCNSCDNKWVEYFKFSSWEYKE